MDGIDLIVDENILNAWQPSDYDKLVQGYDCNGCIVLNDPNPNVVTNFTSPQTLCLWGKVEEVMYVSASLEVPWHKVVKSAYVTVTHAEGHLNYTLPIDLNRQRFYGDVNYSSVLTSVDNFVFDRRIFKVRVGNWSHTSNRGVSIIVNYSDGTYTTIGGPAVCSNCLVVRETGGLQTIESPTAFCPAGTVENPSYQTVSFDVPRKYLIKKIAALVTSDYDQPPMEFGFDLTKTADSERGRWMSGEMSIVTHQDRRTFAFRLRNWSHTNGRNIKIICSYIDGNYTKP